jgi:hypothetical protein
MKEQFVTFKIAELLKKLNFNEPCLSLWRLIDSEPVFNITSDPCYSVSQEKVSYIHGRNAILAPLWQQVQDWVLKTYNVEYHICSTNGIGQKLGDTPEWSINYCFPGTNSRGCDLRLLYPDEMPNAYFKSKYDCLCDSVYRLLKFLQTEQFKELKEREGIIHLMGKTMTI